ncbi:MAG: hypothetical protein VW378_04825 [bacterium]
MGIHVKPGLDVNSDAGNMGLTPVDRNSRCLFKDTDKVVNSLGAAGQAVVEEATGDVAGAAGEAQQFFPLGKIRAEVGETAKAFSCDDPFCELPGYPWPEWPGTPTPGFDDTTGSDDTTNERDYRGESGQKDSKRPCISPCKSSDYPSEASTSEKRKPDVDDTRDAKEHKRQAKMMNLLDTARDRAFEKSEAHKEKRDSLMPEQAKKDVLQVIKDIKGEPLTPEEIIKEREKRQKQQQEDKKAVSKIRQEIRQIERENYQLPDSVFNLAEKIEKTRKLSREEWERYIGGCRRYYPGNVYRVLSLEFIHSNFISCLSWETCAVCIKDKDIMTSFVKNLSPENLCRFLFGASLNGRRMSRNLICLLISKNDKGEDQLDLQSKEIISLIVCKDPTIWKFLPHICKEDAELRIKIIVGLQKQKSPIDSSKVITFDSL